MAPEKTPARLLLVSKEAWQGHPFFFFLQTNSHKGTFNTKSSLVIFFFAIFFASPLLPLLFLLPPLPPRPSLGPSFVA